MLRLGAVDRQRRDVEVVAGCRARSAPRCPARWAGSRAACGRGSPCRSARPTPACSAAKSLAVIAPPFAARMRRRRSRDLAAVEAPRPCVAAIARSARAAAGNANQLADVRARGRAAGTPRRSPAASRSSGVAAAHFCCDDDRHRVAALGDLDRRLQQVGERQLAEALATAPPSRRPRRAPSPNPSRAWAASSRRRRTCCVKYSGVHAAGAGPEAFRPCSFLPSHTMRERVAAEAVAARLDDRHRRRGGDRRVDRVAALPQHAQAGLRARADARSRRCCARRPAGASTGSRPASRRIHGLDDSVDGERCSRGALSPRRTRLRASGGSTAA